jgi:hypothetical protein
VVVEHEFITTREPDDVMGRIAGFLGQRGFAPSPPAAAAPGARPPEGAAFLEMRRGRKKPARVHRLGDLPQAVIAQFDRGRVEVAYMIQPWRDKPTDLHTRAAFSMVKALDELVTQDPGAAAVAWDHVERESDRELSRRTRRYHILLYSVLGIIIALLATVITIIVLAAP